MHPAWRRSPAAPVALLALAAAAWALSAARMEGMDAGPTGDLGGAGWFAGTWVVMMAAMMLPPLAPAVPARVGSGTAFVTGYLLAWAGAGVAAYVLIDSVAALGPGFLAWDEAGAYAAGGVIAAAAVYELTPLKAACLRRCRASLAAVDRGQPLAMSLGMGLRHGAACIGCCWALMAALFALGWMSVVWMAFVAAVVAAERLLPWWPAIGRGVALLLVVLGAGVALTPGSVPGFTEPGEGTSHHAMGR